MYIFLKDVWLDTQELFVIVIELLFTLFIKLVIVL